jgi:peptidoglycan hydrolase-like protein with peptidoglycan-binding domain
MANLRIGSAGTDVEKLQAALGFTGKDVDGIFGQKTERAVKAYQKANGLVEDGIAGEKTLGMLYGAGTASSSTPVTPQATTQQNTADVNTEQPDAVQQAKEMIQQLNAKKPGDYTPVWLDEADSWMSQYQNRDDFSYDVNKDALYQQYKDQYIQQGQLASMDVMGQAAAMTGGYGNSYAQSVGQQAFNQYLGQLNNVVPELYGIAYDQYQQEGKNMLDMYDMYMNREAQERSNYQTEMDNWYREMSRLIGERDAALAEKSNEKSNLINLIAATGYKPTDAELQAAGMTRGQADSYTTAYSTKATADENEKYSKLEVGSTAYNTITKAIRGAKDLGELSEITEEYIKTYGEDAIKNMYEFKKKLAELTPQIDPQLYTAPTGFTGSAGSVGGKWMMSVR